MTRSQSAKPFDELLWLKRKVHQEARRRAYSDQRRKEIQREETGKASCADMTTTELRRVLDALRKHDGQQRGTASMAPIGGMVAGALDGLKKKRPGRDERLPAEPVTREQLDKIEHLRAHVGLHGSRQWMSLCLRVVKHPWPQNRAEANAMIECLKDMERRHWRPRGT